MIQWISRQRQNNLRASIWSWTSTRPSCPLSLRLQSSPKEGILNEDQKFPSLMRMDVRFWVDFQADLAPRCLSRPPDQVEVDLVVRHNLWKISVHWSTTCELSVDLKHHNLRQDKRPEAQPPWRCQRARWPGLLSTWRSPRTKQWDQLTSSHS